MPRASRRSRRWSSSARTPPRLRDLPGATYVERLGAARRLRAQRPARREAMAPGARPRRTTSGRAPTLLPAVRVAVIDSGIDADHPEFAGKIADAKTLRRRLRARRQRGPRHVRRRADRGGRRQHRRHRRDGPLGRVARREGRRQRRPDRRRGRGERDPLGGRAGRARDQHEPGRLPRPARPRAGRLLAARGAGDRLGARQGVVVVAAVGNSTATPRSPWPFASYPAALPHVLGVSALARDGSVPAFSHRDRIYNDIAAPGVGILSTFPRALTAEMKECSEQGYSSCAPDDSARARARRLQLRR